MKKSILALLAVVALFATSCSEQGLGDEFVTPEIEILAGQSGEGSISFNIVLKDAAEAGYMVVEKAEAEASDFATQNVVDNAVLLESAVTQEVVVEDLKDNVDYQVIAYCKAKGNPTAVVSKVIDVRTKGLELSMGFFAYDGIDEASGRHRVNFYGSTNPRNGDKKDYIDVTIFMYLLYDPGDFVTPGNYVPFAEDGSNMDTNLVYKAGKRCLIDGEPNMQGSGWWTLENKEIVAFNPSMEGTHTVTFDAKTKVTTICGSMVDAEKNETLNFTYSTAEPLFRFDDY